MAAGVYADLEIVERWSPTVAAGSLNGFAQPFIAPCDMEIQGLVASVGTAPGSTNVVSINLAITPVSQGIAGYNAYTAANVPTIGATGTRSYVISSSQTLIKNAPYALNYPLPGPSGTVGYSTAQSTSTTTQSPVTTPPTMANYQMLNLTPPDNTYTDLNGVTGTSAGYLHAGDSMLVLIAGTAGSAANMEVVIYALKR
jgi:hypothetical protein